METPMTLFSIKTCDQRGTMVVNLPRKVSRITKFIIDHGATVSIMLTRAHYIEYSRQGWVRDSMQSVSFQVRNLPKSFLIRKI